jgi:NTE family protein
MLTRSAMAFRFALFSAVVSAANGSFAAEYEFDEPNPPRYVAPPATEAKPKLALVLGSGGRRGFAHAGALRALDEAGIKPDLIVGVSIGAVIGALYSAGMSGADVERLALRLDLSEFRDLSWLHWGHVRGQKLQNFVNAQVKDRPLEAFATRFAVVATRERDGAMQIFNRGNTGAAVRASSAVPGRFYKVRIAGETYVDGDVASPVPVRAARLLGAEVVIAVDISARVDNAPKSAPDEWLRRDRDRRARIDIEVKGADVLIHPDIGYYAGTSGSYRERVIAAAAAATRAAVPRITAALGGKRVPATPATATTPAASPAPPAAR